MNDINLNDYKFSEESVKEAKHRMNQEIELHNIWTTHTSCEEVKLLLCLLNLNHQTTIKKLFNQDHLDHLARTVKANETHFRVLTEYVRLHQPVTDNDYSFDFCFEMVFIHMAKDCENLPMGYYKNLKNID